VTNSSNAHVYAIFAEAAFLAGRAVEAATKLQRMPGMSAEAFAETLDFWRRVGAKPTKERLARDTKGRRGEVREENSAQIRGRQKRL